MDPVELRRLFVLANAFKEGDLLVGGTADDRVRADARRALADVRLLDIHQTPVVDDGVTATLTRRLARHRDADLDRRTIGDLKATLLGAGAAGFVRRHRDSLASEAIAAVVKVMTDDELSQCARTIFNPLPGHDSNGVAIGSPHHFGSRIQPNSPGDNDDEILFSILEGLAYGCGDVIIGLNPASDDVDTIVRLESLLERVVHALALPTRYCVLSDIVKQHRARERTRVDVGFQSLAGTSGALGGMVGLDADGILDLARSFDGLYFETGQGSAITNGAAEGVDMVTLEARAYGVARQIECETGAWTIVNDVAGFIGPEVFRNADQLERACLEDTVMAKLHGLTMGLDVCATFHMGIAPDALRHVTERIVDRAAPAYLMAVAGNADPMLGYLTTSFRDHPRLRHRFGRQMGSAMRDRLTVLGVEPSTVRLTPDHDGVRLKPDTTYGGGESDAGDDGAAVARLYAIYAKAGGDARSSSSLEDDGRRMLHELRGRGFDLGYGYTGDFAAPPDVDRRLDAIYAHARDALYARLDRHVIDDVSSRHVRVQTTAADRDDYLAHPPRGEQLRRDAERALAELARASRRPIQIVCSDGLNANAANEQLRALLPPLRRQLADAGAAPNAIDVVIDNARVRAGYQVGTLVDAAIVVHLIGERPGTGLNTLSAYVTYGRDQAGGSRWRSDLDHSCTSAVCGIHPRGKPPASAAVEIAGLVRRMLDQRRSGVGLQS
jgi:ethanolamine ammonia-lyase large subunit